MRAYVLMLSVSIVGSACDSATDISVQGLTPLPAFEQLDFARIQPAENVEYWELRSAFRSCQACNDPPDVVIGSGGPRSRAQLDTSTLRQLDQVRPLAGFATGCLPGYCFMYVAAVQNGVTAHATVAALRAFLGTVETAEEAAVLVRAYGFSWSAGSSDTGMMPVGGGWEFVVLQLVRDCTPVQTDRVRLRIAADGSMRELQRQVWSRNRNACV